jgi:HK97 family phage portal protein
MGFIADMHRPSTRADGGWLDTHIDDFLSARDLDRPGMRTHAGVRVNTDLALTLAGFWQGLRILSENVASFPCHVYERLSSNGKDAGRKVAAGHPVDDLVFRRPNTFQNSFEYWEMTAAHLTLRGNMYSYILPGPRGFVDQLVPIHPDLVRAVLLPTGEMQYIIQTGVGTVKKGGEDIFHIRGLSFDGVAGVSVITYATQDLGGLMAAESFANRFWSQGATAGVAAIPESDVGPDGMELLQKSVRSYLTGLQNAHSVFVPPDKVTLKNIGMKPEDAQLLATRAFSLQHIAQWLNMHPSMLGDPTTVGYASTKQFRQNLVDITFRPLVERIEAAVDAELFLNPDRFFCKFNMASLLRGDPSEQAAVQHTNVVDGVWTRNEARLKQDMNPLDGLDETLEPLNMARTSERNPVAALRRAELLTLDAAKGLVRQEAGAARKAAQRFAGDGAGWQAWLRDFYTEHAQTVAERLRMPLPLAREYAARQGTTLSQRGVGAIDDWDWTVAPALANLALCADLQGRAIALEEAA